MTPRVLFAIALALAVASPAWSHHSHAMFDHSKAVTMEGTVTEFVFRNPHVFLYVDVKGANGETQNYWIEMSNIPNMIRRGIGQGTFKAGDRISVELYPLKDGRPGGSYVTITAADGKVYQ
ncbi:MAG: hypothetical protein FJW14_12175 [Acidimicrobiia bacterium]|nr:hypothetical protein [Acidimicrobiia bacterium]